jgi:hypothetical protein
MGSLSDYYEKKFLDHVFNVAFTAPSTLYIFLSTADPLDDASAVAEPSGFNYARETIAFNAAASRKVENSSLITFNQATGGSWGDITHWGICDHLTNSTFGTNVSLLAHGAFLSQKTVSDGKQPTIAAQEVDIEISAGAVTNYLVHEMLDHLFGVGSFASPDTHLKRCRYRWRSNVQRTVRQQLLSGTGQRQRRQLAHMGSGNRDNPG